MPINDDEYWRQLRNFERSAWRFEKQPAYHVGYEQEQFNAFLAGSPRNPDENADLRDWFAQIRRQVAEGKTIGRVRIVDDPITDYQRWMQWMDRWNRDAGETIDYLTRRDALAAGLPAVGGDDWWLFDDERLVLMRHDESGRRVSVELLADEPEVEQARVWRSIALSAVRAQPNASS